MVISRGSRLTWRAQPHVGQFRHGPAALLIRAIPASRGTRPDAQVEGDPRDAGDRTGGHPATPGRSWWCSDRGGAAAPADRNQRSRRKRAGDHRPAAADANDLSTHSRSGAAASAVEVRALQRGPQPRQAAPVTALTATAGTAPRLVRAIRSSASRVAGRIGQVAAGHGEQAVPDAPTASMAARCSLVLHPPSAATTNSTAGTGPTRPADEPLVTGHVHEGQALAARERHPGEPQVDGQPAAPLRPTGSGSIPLSARTSADLPWSTCPAVADHLHNAARPETMIMGNKWPLYSQKCP